MPCRTPRPPIRKLSWYSEQPTPSLTLWAWQAACTSGLALCISEWIANAAALIGSSPMTTSPSSFTSIRSETPICEKCMDSGFSPAPHRQPQHNHASHGMDTEVIGQDRITDRDVARHTFIEAFSRHQPKLAPKLRFTNHGRRRFDTQPLDVVSCKASLLRARRIWDTT